MFNSIFKSSHECRKVYPGGWCRWWWLSLFVLFLLYVSPVWDITEPLVLLRIRNGSSAALDFAISLQIQAKIKSLKKMPKTVQIWKCCILSLIENVYGSIYKMRNKYTGVSYFLRYLIVKSTQQKWKVFIIF